MTPRIFPTLVLACCAFACSEMRVDLLRETPALTIDGGGGTPEAGTPEAGPLPDGSPFDAGPRAPVLCAGNRACACDDGKDNDDDGLADGLDPECTGAHDDDEASFDTALPGERDGECLDCFWDRNGGFGDDGCRYPVSCLQGTPPATADPGCSSCTVSDACIQNCRASTPNGCDCFGCCEVTLEDGTRDNVQLVETCSLDVIADREACPRCDLHPDCRNACGGCELCPGRRVEDLPASCATGGSTGDPGYRCDEGQQVCSAERPCGPDFYCQLGCCLLIPQ